MKALSSTLLLLATTTFAAAETTKKAPPPFLLQDATDSLCMAGEDFRRCSIHTLWYVVGSPGSYQIKKRTQEAEQDEDGVCLAKKSCKDTDKDKILPTVVTKCSHCGAKDWNILGDSEHGYILTAADGHTCLIRVGKEVKTAPCDSAEKTQLTLQLQFASASDITAMSSPAARFIGAASDGDKKAIQALLKEGIDVNIRDWDELTAFIPAASSGDLEIVKLLHKEGADINAADKDGITALMEAGVMGHTKVAEFLVEQGAEVDAMAKSGVTAMWLAAGEGKLDTVKFLLQKGADASNTRVDGITALMTASVGGHAEVVKLLLENGADAYATDGDQLTALMNAAENGSKETVQILVEATNKDYVNAFSKTGFNALIIAAAHGHATTVEYLIDAGADMNAKHAINEVTPLMYAAASGHLECMKVLIAKGTDVAAKHTNGGTALLEAATAGGVEAIRILIEAGAEYNFRDDDGVTPLMAVASQGHLEGQTLILDKLKETMTDSELKEHINMLSFSGGSSVMFAAAGGHYNCTKQLMDLGADINAIAKATSDYMEKLTKLIEGGKVDDEDPHVDGVTALHVAAQSGHLTTVELLLAAGANVDVKDDEDRTALMLAVKGNYGKISALLVKSGANPNTKYVDADGEVHNLLMDAIMVENLEFALLLVENGADLYYKDSKGVTTLLQASHRGMTEVVAALLEKHSKTKERNYIDEPSEEGVTPLIAACSEGHKEVVDLLIKAGADVNAKDKDATNALMAAAARGQKDVVQSLLNAKCDINAQNSDGHTALMFAYNGKNQVQTLFERYDQYIGDDQETDDGGTGPVIQKALESHIALVDLLLKKGADPSLKDKQGNTAKDFDYHPDADAEVLSNAEKIASKKDEL